MAELESHWDSQSYLHKYRATGQQWATLMQIKVMRELVRHTNYRKQKKINQF